MPVLRRRGCGLSIRAIELARRLTERGHDVAFAVEESRTDVRDGRVAGVPVRRIGGGRCRGSDQGAGFSVWRAHWSLQALARRAAATEAVEALAGDGEVLISCQPEAVSALGSRNDGRPVVFVCGGSTVLHDEADRQDWAKRPWWRRWPYHLDRYWKQQNERRAFRIANLVVFDSESTRRRVISAYGLPADHGCAVHGGVDERRFAPADATTRRRFRRELNLGDTDFVVVWTGRLAVEKNLSLLLRALPHCRRPPERVLLVGAGPLRRDLEAEAAELGVSGRVRFLGEQDDVRPFLHAADVFAFPSRGESFGGALAEGMACGLACVAVRPDGQGVCNANEEILGSDQFGLLAEARPEAFAEGLDNLRDRPEWRRRLGQAASRRALTCFTWAAAADRLESLLLRLIRRAGASDISSIPGGVGSPAWRRAGD